MTSDVPVSFGFVGICGNLHVPIVRLVFNARTCGRTTRNYLELESNMPLHVTVITSVCASKRSMHRRTHNVLCYLALYIRSIFVTFPFYPLSKHRKNNIVKLLYEQRSIVLVCEVHIRNNSFLHGMPSFYLEFLYFHIT